MSGSTPPSCGSPSRYAPICSAPCATGRSTACATTVFSYIPFEELGEVFASPESLQIETDEITQLVAEAVSQLPGRCRDIFLKSRNEQLSNAEIAAEMHISVKTVEAQMSKALRRLRGLLHKE